MKMPEHVPSQNASPGNRDRAMRDRERDQERAQLPGDTLLEPSPAPSPGPRPTLALEGFNEQPFGSPNWLDVPTASLVDHPLLRGLLLELPPRGSQPTAEWLNRWFEATRSVLDLIYQRNR
jgi:hypothetical protein